MSDALKALLAELDGCTFSFDGRAKMEAIRNRIRATLEQPSTAEIRARALDDAADNLLNQADRMENSVISQRATRDAAFFLSKMAQRIREER